jgi:hypothetical protein
MTGLELFCPSQQTLSFSLARVGRDAVHPFPRPAHGAHPPGCRRIQAHSRARAHAHTLTLACSLTALPLSLSHLISAGRRRPRLCLHRRTGAFSVRIRESAAPPAHQPRSSRALNTAIAHPLTTFVCPSLFFSPRPCSSSASARLRARARSTRSSLGTFCPGCGAGEAVLEGTGERARIDSPSQSTAPPYFFFRARSVPASKGQAARSSGVQITKLANGLTVASEDKQGSVRAQAGGVRGGRPTLSSHHDSNIPFAHKNRRPPPSASTSRPAAATTPSRALRTPWSTSRTAAPSSAAP